jgi:hypothetical protein
MTTVAIMQPYIFPYLGYYQLVAKCDYFVFLDDVNFIVRGFINRNNILHGNRARRITLPVLKISQNRPINRHWYVNDCESLDEILNVYARAPHFKEVVQFGREIRVNGEGNVAETNALSVINTLAAIGIRPKYLRSSELGIKLVGVDRIIAICHRLGASRYVNLPGGRSLYEASRFAADGIELEFVDPYLRPYSQPCDFVPALSILDALMWEGFTGVRDLLVDEIVTISNGGNCR